MKSSYSRSHSVLPTPGSSPGSCWVTISLRSTAWRPALWIRQLRAVGHASQGHYVPTVIRRVGQASSSVVTISNSIAGCLIELITICDQFPETSDRHPTRLFLEELGR